METCDEQTAQFMAGALLSHAKEIYRYAKAFCEPTLANQAVGEGHKRKFALTVERMLNEMHALMLMAGYKGVSRYCNREQIDAYMDEARRIVMHGPALGKPSPILN